MTDNITFRYDKHTNTKPYLCIALINGLQVVYGKADPNFTQVTDRPYLGRGTIYSANGVPQLGKDLFHFWGAREGETLTPIDSPNGLILKCHNCDKLHEMVFSPDNPMDLSEFSKTIKTFIKRHKRCLLKETI